MDPRTTNTRLRRLRRAAARGVKRVRQVPASVPLLGTGAASTAYGAGAIYEPAGFIAGGLLLMWLAWPDSHDAAAVPAGVAE